METGHDGRLTATPIIIIHRGAGVEIVDECSLWEIQKAAEQMLAYVDQQMRATMVKKAQNAPDTQNG